VALADPPSVHDAAQSVVRPAPQLVRCACAECGTHTNAVQTFRLIGSCSNCGSFELVPIDGAEPLGGPVAA
jgi:hypothetical protein